MGPLYFLILSIITPTGELQMSAQPVPNCDGKEQFQVMMDTAVKEGEIKEWNAICLAVGDKGHAI
jgi:hypothetical protein